MEKSLTYQIKVFKQNTVDFISEEQLEEKLKKSLKSGKPLKIKAGFDPTAADIHLGHAVVLRKLRQIQDLGHFVYLIIGDFTANIGDPSGKVAQRPVVSQAQIKENAATYARQAFKILNKRRTKVIYNSTWYKKMNLPSFLSLLSSYTVARILERDDFSNRLKQQKPLSLLEIIYPLIQGYDSCMLAADMELGGTDQKFNLIVGRHLQEVFNQSPQIIATMPLLIGLDGKQKMSKSLENYIAIKENPKEMFGKVMSISDQAMWEYFRLLTEVDVNQEKNNHPKEAKTKLARLLVSFFHSLKEANRESEEFAKVFSQKLLPEKMPVFKAKAKKIDVIEVLLETKMTASKNEARRLLQQGSITMIDSKDAGNWSVLSNNITFFSEPEIVLKIGKKRFLKIIT